MLDHGSPRLAFLSVAVLLMLAIGTVVQVRRSALPTHGGHAQAAD